METIQEDTSAMMSFWIQFFCDAGIPASNAESYAVSFTEHRIQKDMLIDLTKDYLADMGVSVIGDVIAILKQAKAVQSKSQRQVAQSIRATNNATPDKNHMQSSSCERKLMPASQRFKPAGHFSSPASRFVNHYIKNDKRLKSDLAPHSTNSSPEITRRVSLAPAASTSRQVSVFDRLGQSFVGSQGMSVVACLDLPAKPDLRGSLKRPATSTSHDIDDDSTESDGSACEYAGVLKKTRPKTKKLKHSLPVNRNLIRSRGNYVSSVHTEGIFGKRRLTASVRKRLG